MSLLKRLFGTAAVIAAVVMIFGAQNPAQASTYAISWEPDADPCSTDPGTEC